MPTSAQASKAPPKAPALKAQAAPKAPHAEAPPAPEAAPKAPDGLVQPEPEPSQPAPAEATPGAPTQAALAQAAPPQGYAYYCMSALAEIDPEKNITNPITKMNSQEAQDFRHFESRIAELHSGLTEKLQLLEGALDSQSRTIAQLEEAIVMMASEQDLMIGMHAQLEAISVKVGSFLAQKEKEKEAAQLAEMTRLAAEELRLQKQVQAQNILETMHQNDLSLEDLEDLMSAQKRKAAEPSMSAEPPEKKLKVTEAQDDSAKPEMCHQKQ